MDQRFEKSFPNDEIRIRTGCTVHFKLETDVGANLIPLK